MTSEASASGSTAPAAHRSSPRPERVIPTALVSTVGDNPSVCWLAMLHAQPSTLLLVTSERTKRAGLLIRERLAAIVEDDTVPEELRKLAADMEVHVVSVGADPGHFHGAVGAVTRVLELLDDQDWFFSGTGGTKHMSLALLMKHLELYPEHPELRFDVYGDHVHYSDGEQEPLPDELIRTVDLLALHGLEPESNPRAEPLTRALLTATRRKDLEANHETGLFEDDIAEAVLDDGEFSEVFLKLRVYPAETKGSTGKEAVKEFDVLARCGATFYAIEAKTNPWDVVRTFGHHLTSTHRCLGSQARVYWCVQDRTYRRGQSVAAHQAEEIDWLSRNSMQYRAASFTLDSLRDDIAEGRERRRAYRRRETLAIPSPATFGNSLGPLREAARARTVLVCPLGGSPAVVDNAVSHVDPEDARLVLLATERSLPASHDLAAEWRDRLDVVVVEIDQFDSAVLEEILDLCRAQANELIFDVTGGTKIVSARLAAWAREQGISARLQDIRTGRVEDLGDVSYHASVPAEGAPVLSGYTGVSRNEAVQRAAQTMCVDRVTLQSAVADVSAAWNGEIHWFVDERSDPEDPHHDEWCRSRAHPRPPVVALNGQAALGMVALNPKSWSEHSGRWLGPEISPGLAVESAAASMALLRGDLGHLLVLCPRRIFDEGKLVSRLQRVPAVQAAIHVQSSTSTFRNRAAVRDFLRRLVPPGAATAKKVEPKESS